MPLRLDEKGHLRMTTHEDEYTTMEESLAFYDPRRAVVDAILAAYNDPEWDWRKCDGCTVVSECGYPKGFRHPVCVCHDRYCWLADRATTKEERARLRREGDRLLYWGHRDYGEPWVRAAGRWLGVRLYWHCIARWR
jgi:hypothetical protein